MVDNFLSPEKCACLLEEVSRGSWVDSVVANASGGSKFVGGRRSRSLVVRGYSRAVRKVLAGLETRLQEQFGVLRANLEPWQITQYRRGDRYDYHLDCGDRHPSGERRRSIMLVIEQPVCGGATHFRALDLAIRPVLGRLCTWSNLLPNGRCNHAMIHAGRPVWRGRKTILTVWERLNPYVSSQ